MLEMECFNYGGQRSLRQKHDLCGDKYAWAHRGADRDALDVMTLHRVRLDALNVVNKGVDVFDQLLLVEAQFADHRMNDAACVVAEFDLAGLVLLDGFS